MVNDLNYSFFSKCAVFVIASLSCFHYTYGACSFPTEIVDSWHDSREGTTTFGSSTINGLVADFGSYGTISDWACRTETFSTNGRVLLRATNSITILFQPWYVHLCLEFVEITPDSYIYYRKHEQEGQAGGARVKSVLTGTDDDAVTMANTCDDAKGATGAEFAIIIRQGSESNAYIQCPSPLLGRFNFTYTDSGGTTYCDDHSNPEHLNVCTDKTQLQFETPCSQTPVYASGSVYCVATVDVGGTTFVQLYNPGASDNSAFYQFSCLAISSDSLSATIVYKNCTNQMTSSVVAVDRTGTTIGSTIVFSPYVFCQGGCTWPSPFVSSTWLDNTRGTIVFGTDTLSGWSMTITGTTISTWECLDNSYFASEGILLVKATDTFSLVGANWITYLCLQMTGVSSNSYTYYQQAERDSKGEDERALFSQSGLITDKATICSSSTVPSAEFHFMVKQGEEVASIQKCASPLLNKFNYEVTDTSNTVTCSGDASWDVCTNTSMMTFDYSLCPTNIAYSSGSDEVYCMASITASGYDYSVVYSTGSFACIVSNSDGTAATFVNNNCTVDQTPTVFAMSPDGTNIGYKTTMTITESCFTTTTTTTTTSTTSTTSTTTSNTTSGASGTTSGGDADEATNPSTSTPDDSGGSIIPMVAGAAVGVLLLLAILFLIYWFCYRKKRFCFKKKEVEHNDEAMNSVTGGNGPVIEDKKPPQNEPGPEIVPDMSAPLPNIVTTPRTLPSISN